MFCRRRRDCKPSQTPANFEKSNTRPLFVWPAHQEPRAASPRRLTASRRRRRLAARSHAQDSRRQHQQMRRTVESRRTWPETIHSGSIGANFRQARSQNCDIQQLDRVLDRRACQHLILDIHHRMSAVTVVRADQCLRIVTGRGVLVMVMAAARFNRRIRSRQLIMFCRQLAAGAVHSGDFDTLLPVRANAADKADRHHRIDDLSQQHDENGNRPTHDETKPPPK